MRSVKALWPLAFLLLQMLMGSCIGKAVPMPTDTPAPQASPGPIPQPVETPFPVPIVTPIPTTIPTPPPTPTPSPVLIPDLKPHSPPDWGAPLVFLSQDGRVSKTAVPYQKGSFMGVALTNASNGDSDNFYVELKVDGKNAYLWDFEALKSGAVATEAASLDYLIDYLSLKPGKHLLELVVDAGGYILETDKSNNRHLAEVEIATDLPDLKPHTPQGWDAPIKFISSEGSLLQSGVPFQPGRSVVATVINSGTRTAVNVPLSLLIDGTLVYTAVLPQVLPGRFLTAAVPLDDAVVRYKLKSGRHVFQLIVDPQNDIEELDNTNNSYSADIDVAVARAPVARREPQSPAEAKIQKMFDEYTWISGSNIDEVVEIAKEVLKDIPIDWSIVRVNALPFDEFNVRYGQIAGRTPEEKIRAQQSVAATPLTGYAFFQGSNLQQSIVVREGLLAQVLPFVLREIGGGYYIRTNPQGLMRSSAIPTQEFVVDIAEAYGLQVLKEKFGWDGLARVSHLIRPDVESTVASYVNSDELLGVSVRIPWLIAAESGHPDGRVPSDVLLRTFLNFVSMSDPGPYINSVVARSQAMDRGRVIAAIESRVVDKELTIIPEPVRQRLDPGRKYGNELSLDLVLINQLSFYRP